MVICKYCKSVLDSTERYCPYCGNSLEVNEKNISSFYECPKCHMSYLASDIKCPSCGEGNHSLQSYKSNKNSRRKNLSNAEIGLGIFEIIIDFLDLFN